MNNIELTVLIPCLNEEQTLAICINKATRYMRENGINGEVVVADNGSTDSSIEIAKKNGARVINVPVKGYGSALIHGSKAAKGLYTIMADADDSYNFLELNEFIDALRAGNEFVIGNRYKANLEKGAMPLLHRYLGTPIISFIGRMRCKVKVGDFNCGMRGYVTEKVNNLNCKSTGMEYATEMILKASKAKLKIKEVPINFYKDKRTRKPHLNPVRDGIRHLKILFTKID